MKTLKVVAALMVLLWLSGVSGGFAQSGTERPFITKWQGTKDKGLKIPIVGKYKMVIKDGSGNEKVNETVTVADAKHPYIFTPTEDGTYTVEAGPEGVKYMRMTIPLTSNDKLLDVVQFGTVKWESMEEMFQECKNMTFAAGIDTPDLSEVTSMKFMFLNCRVFNQPLGNWKVDNVTNMEKMFSGCSTFNQPLGNWKVDNVTNMKWMFFGCRSFNQPLDNWKVSNVTNMERMFFGCSTFNQPIGNWNVSKVTKMYEMFMDCSTFNQPIGNWNVSKVTNMGKMFFGCSTFNQPLGNWNVSGVENMGEMFSGCAAFNQPLDDWKVDNVTNMNMIFFGCASFNQPLDNWKVSKVTDMMGIFYGCSTFNQPLNNWDVSNVANMWAMFNGCSTFNQSLNNWDVSNVTDMSWIFRECSSFNQPLDNWKVSNVTNMWEMFKGCRSFNQPLGNWNVSNVTDMREMFSGCSAFNQPLGSWKIKTVVGGLNETAMSPSNYSQTLVGWAGQTDIAGSLNFGKNVENLIYNDEGKEAHQKLIDNGWTFEGDILLSSGVAITPHFFSLVLNKECTLPLEKWGVAETEEVTLSTDKGEIISYELTTDKKGVHIVGLKEGKCKLTATIAAKPGVHEQAYTNTCEIEVYIPVEYFSVTPASKTLKVGKEFTLTANIFPENATKREVTWWSYDSEIATMDDNNGKITAKAAGTCWIYAEIHEYGRTVYGKCEVNVVDEIAYVTHILLPENRTLQVGTTTQLVAVVLPNHAEQGLVWNSSDPEIATVSEGFVWGKKKGTCTITVKSLDPTCSITKECKISVEGPKFPVTLTQHTNGKIAIEGHATETTITVEQGTTLTVTVTPDKGYKLKSLTAGEEDITNSKQFTVKAATEVKAVFEKETFAVKMSVNDEKGGEIELTGATDLKAVEYGTELTVMVTEKEGYKLKSLTAGDKDIMVTKKFTVTAATEVKAVFEYKQGGAVEDALLAGIVVAPNPFASQLRILNLEGVVAHYELVNAAGVVVRSGALSGSEAIVDTETLPTGVYFVRLEAQNGARKTLTVSK